MRPGLLLTSIIVGLIFGASASDRCLAQGVSPPPNAGGRPQSSVKILPEDREAPKGEPVVKTANLDTLNATIKVENPAGVSLELVPSGEVVAGSKVGFRITTKKQGYLILLDIDATGKLTQIFPAVGAAVPMGREGTNLIRSGRPLTLPQLGSPHESFEFVAEPPAGIAMVVALLSDRPVQVVDLPDSPPPGFAPSGALEYVIDKTRTLLIAGDKGNQLVKPNWSFDGKFYLIK